MLFEIASNRILEKIRIRDLFTLRGNSPENASGKLGGNSCISHIPYTHRNNLVNF